MLESVGNRPVLRGITRPALHLHSSPTWRVAGLGKDGAFRVISIITPSRIPLRGAYNSTFYLVTTSPEPPSTPNLYFEACDGGDARADVRHS